MDGMGTPWKINMEPKNHPFRKENDLETSMIMFHVNLPGCNPVNLRNGGLSPPSPTFARPAGSTDWRLLRACLGQMQVIHLLNSRAVLVGG